ncbi:flagellar assembly protein FliW [Psychrobacillus psychrodurans]|uniref:flagellar assembly protein FliW n=1 Tax=Psychrobacillus psychrodurans TaxID=126157 RepID=UPI001F4DB7E7|nr:flagellar assembly protein FliW [Psychrobacillus psychrodurans]MCK1995971.1 flagellar assembly protein FliW [Psychrobacillus psychrodurans]
MLIQTKFFGEIKLNSEQLWSFPKGIPGFEDEKEFVLLPIEGNSIFQVLQSTKKRDIALIVANPYVLVHEYSFDIDEPTIELLDIKQEDDIFVLGVLSLKEPLETSTINLQAPIIFHTTKKISKQMIINDNRFAVRHVIGSKPLPNKEEA